MVVLQLFLFITSFRCLYCAVPALDAIALYCYWLIYKPQQFHTLSQQPCHVELSYITSKLLWQEIKYQRAAQGLQDIKPSVTDVGAGGLLGSGQAVSFLWLHNAS